MNITTLTQAFQTTEKAMLNTVEKAGFRKSQDGYQVVVMDNQYISPTLLVTLLDHYHIGAIGTIQSNRISLDKDYMTLSKKEAQGTT